MSILVLNDRSEHYLDDVQTNAVERSLAKSNDGFIQVAGLTIKKSAIQQIRPGGKTQADILDPWATEPSQQIEERKCKGSHSLQREINGIAKDDGGNAWAKLVADKKWREQTRQKLLEADPDGWCDYLSGACICYER